jgi:hypothetical protein
MLVSFRYYREFPVWNLLHTNKEQHGENRNTAGIHRNADYILKNTPTNHNEYVVNQKLENLNDASSENISLESE